MAYFTNAFVAWKCGVHRAWVNRVCGIVCRDILALYATEALLAIYKYHRLLSCGKAFL